MKIIELTELSSKQTSPIHINPDHIVSMKRSNAYRFKATFIVLLESSSPVFVEETVEQIKKRIKEAPLLEDN